MGQTADEVKERVVRPLSRSIIRDVFNEITSEEYYQVTVKNRMAETAKEQLATALAPLGVAVDMLQLHQHRFDPEYQDAINAQKQAEADVQMLVERQKAVVVQKQTELEGKRSEWNQKVEVARGEAGSVRNEADGYYQTQTNQAKAIVVTAQAAADGVRKEAEALSKLGGDAYVKMQVSKRFADKRIYLVPGSNVSTLDVNSTLNFLMKDAASKVRAQSKAAEAATPAEEAEQPPSPAAEAAAAAGWPRSTGRRAAPGRARAGRWGRTPGSACPAVPPDRPGRRSGRAPGAGSAAPPRPPPPRPAPPRRGGPGRARGAPGRRRTRAARWGGSA